MTTARQPGGGLQAVKRLLDLFDRWLIIATGVALVILTFLITIDVVARFVFNHPLPATTEMSELLMAYIVFLAMGYTLSRGQHIRITVLFEYLPRHWKKYFDLLADVIGTGFCAVVTYYAWAFFAHSYSVREEMLAVVRLPWYVGKFAMPLGFLFFTLRYALRSAEALVELFSGRVEATARELRGSDAGVSVPQDLMPQRQHPSSTSSE
jgi:TRAP-type C4-dicarboxylate transport system permease small subunit